MQFKIFNHVPVNVSGATAAMVMNLNCCPGYILICVEFFPAYISTVRNTDKIQTLKPVTGAEVILDMLMVFTQIKTKTPDFAIYGVSHKHLSYLHECGRLLRDAKWTSRKVWMKIIRTLIYGVEVYFLHTCLMWSGDDNRESMSVKILCLQLMVIWERLNKRQLDLVL